MKVKHLIEQLEKMPQDAEVFHLWDGEPRTSINIVYECKSGQVITSDFDEICYSPNARPKNMNIEGDSWRTKVNPSEWKESDDFPMN